MKSKFIIALLCLALGLGFFQIAHGNADSQVNSKQSSDLILPKIFNFERFKSVFNKRYSSFVEELARRKIFLGRAFRAFLSFVGYKHFRNDYYLKISDRSDWTGPEIKATFNRELSKKLDRFAPKEFNFENYLQETPVASIEDIKAKFEEIYERPEYAQLSAEIVQVAGEKSRVKRQIGSERDNLELADLFGEPKVIDEHLDRVKSNNPYYYAPELTSFGLEHLEEKKHELSPKSIGVISNLPGRNFVNQISAKASQSASGSTRVNEIKKLAGPDTIYVDHRNSGCFLVPKNQKQCGACYIFATTSMYEWKFCQETGKKISFSEQYPLDCGERSNLQGCDGGSDVELAMFHGKFGFELTSHYPYREQSDICPYDKDLDPKHMGFIKLNDPFGNMMSVKKAGLSRLLKESPLLIALGVSDEFSEYGGGIDNGADCKPENVHLMLIVGAGRESGQDYWLLRNSYGTAWGLDGYYKLNKNGHSCFLRDGQAFFPRAPPGKTVFEIKINSDYYSRAVMNRRQDILKGRTIPRNPFTYVEKDRARNIVTPSPNRG